MWDPVLFVPVDYVPPRHAGSRLVCLFVEDKNADRNLVLLMLVFLNVLQRFSEKTAVSVSFEYGTIFRKNVA